MALAPVRPGDIIVRPTGQPTPEFTRFLDVLYDRQGGASGAGGVTGPASSSDNAVARWNGTSGTVVQDGPVLIDDDGNVSIPATKTVDGRDVSADGTALDNHVASTANPHSVTPDQQIGALSVYEVTINQSDLAGAGQKIILDSSGSQTWKVRQILLSGDGTNFSGGGGDRLLAITDGTSTWTLIPAATLQSLAAARWGDTGVPFPATAAHLTAASGAGADIVAQYSGGTADYTAGECTVIVIAERTA